MSVIEKLRLVCLDLPEAKEEKAWEGTRWVIRKKNFAHVVMISDGHPPAYAKALGQNGPACVLTFRVPKLEATAARFTKSPFFKPPWFANIVGVVLNDATDWDEVGTFVRRSYVVLAPKNLGAQIDV